MQAGQLRHRVTLQALVNAQDSTGQPVITWIDTATVWADVRYGSGLSAIKSGADMSVTQASIRMRYRAVNAGQRIVYGNEVFEIEAVLPDTRRVFLDCAVKVINADT